MTANNKSTYYELLKHPKWQKKRLEILEAAGFECECCGGKEKTLHVHHKYYQKGLKPWEYPDDSLQCLCEDCHVIYQSQKESLNKLIRNLDFTETEELIGYIKGINMLEQPKTFFKVESYEEAEGVANYWELDTKLLVSSLKKTDSRVCGNNIRKIKRALLRGKI